MRILLALAMLFSSILHARPALQCDSPLFHHNADGKALAGSKQRVMEAASRGQRLRVGWAHDWTDTQGEHGLVHWADASFITLFEGEVFAQVPAIHRQKPLQGEARIALPAPYLQWHGLLSTNGRLTGHFSHDDPPHELPVEALWCNVPAP